MEKTLPQSVESKVSSPLSTKDSSLGALNLTITHEVRNTITLSSGDWVGEEGKGLLRVISSDKSTLINLKYYRVIGENKTQKKTIEKALKHIPPIVSQSIDTPKQTTSKTPQQAHTITSLIQELEEATSNPKKSSSKKGKPLNEIIGQLKTELKKLPLIEETPSKRIGTPTLKQISTPKTPTTKTPDVKTVKHTPDEELRQVELIGRLIKKVSSFTSRREALKKVKEEDKLILLGRQQKKDLSLIEAYLSTLKQDICFSITDKFYVYKGEFASCKRLIPTGGF
jgi:hypothetical protein